MSAWPRHMPSTQWSIKVSPKSPLLPCYHVNCLVFLAICLCLNCSCVNLIFYYFIVIVAKEIQPVHSEGDQPWDFFGRNDTKAEAPVLWPPHAKSWLIGKDWCWEGLGAGGEGDDRGWDGWMASRTRWTWVWVNSRRWWWTGRPGVLRLMGSQRVGHDSETELNTIYLIFKKNPSHQTPVYYLMI